jgi:hypothetical protein
MWMINGRVGAEYLKREICYIDFGRIFSFLRRIRKTAKNDHQLRHVLTFRLPVRPSVRPSVCPHGTTQLQLTDFDEI